MISLAISGFACRFASIQSQNHCGNNPLLSVKHSGRPFPFLAHDWRRTTPVPEIPSHIPQPEAPALVLPNQQPDQGRMCEHTRPATASPVSIRPRSSHLIWVHRRNVMYSPQVGLSARQISSDHLFLLEIRANNLADFAAKMSRRLFAG
jgi:hypothetical protein